MLFISLMNEESLSEAVVALKALKCENTSWKRVSGRLGREQGFHQLCRYDEKKMNTLLIRAAAALEKNRSVQSTAYTTEANGLIEGYNRT